MRDVLLKRIRPLVERLANDLADLALARIELDLAKLPEVFEAALSSYASDAAPEPPAAAPVFAGPAIILSKVRPDLVENGLRLAALPVTVFAAALQANGKKVVTCKKCGFVGGNARGCGTAHATKVVTIGSATCPPHSFVGGDHQCFVCLKDFPERDSRVRLPPSRSKADPDAAPMTAIAPERRLKPTPEAIAAAKVRVQERLARIAVRSGAPAREVIENPNADERWSPQRISEERELAESRKLEGSLPVPHTTFTVTSRGARAFGADLGAVDELFGATGE